MQPPNSTTYQLLKATEMLKEGEHLIASKALPGNRDAELLLKQALRMGWVSGTPAEARSNAGGVQHVVNPRLPHKGRKELEDWERLMRLRAKRKHSR